MNEIIERLSKEYVTKALDDIDAIFSAYKTALKQPAQRPTIITRIAKIAHDMKGQGGSFGYPIMSEIAASLGTFCKVTPDPRTTQLEVVTAHVEAMRTVMAEDLRGDIGETGHTLLSILAVVSLKHAGEVPT